MRTASKLGPKTVMSAEVNEQGEGCHAPPVARNGSADLALLHSLMGHYARQLLDIQKVRVAMGNRIAAMERDGLPEEYQQAVLVQVEALEKAEHAIELQLVRLARKHPLRQWVEQAPGIGLPGFARLVGIIGTLDRFPNVAKLWAYLGLHVVDGGAAKRRKGERANWSPAGRVLMHQIGEAIVKVNRGPYREHYDRMKARYEQERPAWTPAHRHMAAMRVAQKELLKDMWLEWRRLRTFDARVDHALPLAA